MNEQKLLVNKNIITYVTYLTSFKLYLNTDTYTYVYYENNIIVPLTFVNPDRRIHYTTTDKCMKVKVIEFYEVIGHLKYQYLLYFVFLHPPSTKEDTRIMPYRPWLLNIDIIFLLRQSRDNYGASWIVLGHLDRITQLKDTSHRRLRPRDL